MSIFKDKLEDIRKHWKAEFPENHDALAETGFAEGFFDGTVQKATERLILLSPAPDAIEAAFLKAKLLDRLEALGDAKAERAGIDDMIAACDTFLKGQPVLEKIFE
jgi:hypothetical protein